MEFIGNAKNINKKDLPKIGEIYTPAPTYGRAIKIENIKTYEGYTIFNVWYGLPEDDFIRALYNDLQNATLFTFAIKN